MFQGLFAWLPTEEALQGQPGIVVAYVKVSHSQGSSSLSFPGTAGVRSDALLTTSFVLMLVPRPDAEPHRGIS